jgi:anti-sigma regulatory factor (Ser/Thr protein kinase)
MKSPAGGRRHRTGSVVLGSVTIPGHPRNVSQVRDFVRQTSATRPAVDSDAATLLVSELVTNAILHTKSGTGGAVTVIVASLAGGLLVEVTDDGAPGQPVVKSDLYAARGHGLFLVQQVAAQWGYMRDPAGTTV